MTAPSGGRAADDELTALFPIPLLRCPGVLPAAVLEAVTASVATASLEPSRRSERLSHTGLGEVGGVHRRLAELAAPKLADFGALLFGERLDWTVKEMWTNVLERGGEQSMHAHANSFVSGVFYITPSHPGCRTVFVRPPGGADFMFRHQTGTMAVGPYNGPEYALPRAEPGDLVLFPSYLFHQVPRNEGTRRITVAFNAIPDRLDAAGYRILFSPAKMPDVTVTSRN